MNFRVMAGETDSEYFVYVSTDKEDEVGFYVKYKGDDDYEIGFVEDPDVKPLLNSVSPKPDIINSHTMPHDLKQGVIVLIVVMTWASELKMASEMSEKYRDLKKMTPSPKG
jgi:hypothetical protein